MKRKLFIAFILIFLISQKAPALPQVDKNLIMQAGSSHLLSFDEKIVRYKFENEKIFKAEILSNLFNTRKELLITPVKNLNGKLSVWTDSRMYSFDIKFDKNVGAVSKTIIEKGCTSGSAPSIALRTSDNNDETCDFKIDPPPYLSENTVGVTDFELDSPPAFLKK